MAAINQIKTILLLGILTAVLLFIGSLFGPTGLTIAIIFVVAMNMITYFFSHKIVLVMYRAKEAKKSDYPKLHKLVEDLAKKANIPKPKIYTIPTENLNAFATGNNPKNGVVACTEGILKLLDYKELEGVLAHEISHIKNRDILITTIAATIGGIISYIAMIARFGAIFGGDRDRSSGNILVLLALSILAPLAAIIIQLAISRTREYQADASGASLIKDGKHLATALEKLHSHNKTHPMGFGNPATSSLFIVNPFDTRSFFITLFSTHPPYNKRTERLRAMKF